MTEITWPQFKHQHANLTNEEISHRWKRFKEGKYLIGNDATTLTTEEAPRDEKELEELTVLEESTKNIDNNHGNDLDYIKKVEEEMAVEEIIEEVVEEPKPEVNNDTLAQRLRDSAIYGI